MESENLGPPLRHHVNFIVRLSQETGPVAQTGLGPVRLQGSTRGIFRAPTIVLLPGAGAQAREPGGRSASTYYRKRGSALDPRIPRLLAEAPWKNPTSPTLPARHHPKVWKPLRPRKWLRRRKWPGVEVACGCLLRVFPRVWGMGSGRPSLSPPALGSGVSVTCPPAAPPARARRPSPPACRRLSLMATHPPARRARLSPSAGCWKFTYA